MYDTGTTTLMIICTMLVFLMTPALAFFYGGLSRRKNVVNTMFMSMAALGIVGVVWVLWGWSLAFGGDGSNPFIGGFDQCGLLAENGFVFGTNSAGDAAYPPLLNVAFQGAFAIITVAVITGSLAGRMKFTAVLAFSALWVTFIYAPLAHMVWGGPDSFIGGTLGAIDFAGGYVVETASGTAGLVMAVLLGRRKGFGLMNYRPHNVPYVVLGAGLLWFGWLGFNAGSAFSAGDTATIALINTLVAPCGAMLSWMAVERAKTGKYTLVGAATGCVAGLVVITPTAGYVEPWVAVLLGLITSPVCYYAISSLKHKLGYDDALDVFGLHGIGGIIGVIMNGIFCLPSLSPNGSAGLVYTGDPTLLLSQLAGLGVTLAFVGAGTFVVGGLIKIIFKGSLKVSAEEEAQGLDVAAHGESGYPSFIGLD